MCNAVETLLVDRGIAKYLYPKLAELLRVHGVEIRGDVEVLSHWPGANSATEEDWRTEYLDLILSVKTVTGLEEAVAHINGYVCVCVCVCVCVFFFFFNDMWCGGHHRPS